MIDDSKLPKSQKEFTIHLTISKTNNYFYTLFKGYRRKKEVTSAKYTAKEREFVEMLLSKFECVCIPSSKSSDQIYKKYLAPHLRKEVAKTIESSISEIERKLDEISSEITSELSLCGVGGFDIKFQLPSKSELYQIFGDFRISIKDKIHSDLYRKGMGIQCLSLFSSFKTLSKAKSEEGKRMIWLVEEPESYLHPSLSRSCNTLFRSLGSESYVILTTHSLPFVSDDAGKIIEVINGDAGTVAKKHTRTFDAVTSIRENLGVRFSDFFNFGNYNVFVEGKTDKEYLNWFLTELGEEDGFKERWGRLKKAHIEEFGGVSDLGAFIRYSYQHINKEVSCVAMFDGDEAGFKERKSVQSFLNNKHKIGFEANKDFVSLRKDFAIEGLFPDSWIIEIYEQHTAWFKDFSVDAQGVVEGFTLQDGNKRGFMSLVTSRTYLDHSEWSGMWIKLADALEGALTYQEEKIKPA
ncbi:hypothetical protein D3C73_847240 [compost metagenome]